LVSLGWDIDKAGMNRFAGSIAVQTEAVRELGEGLKEAALKVVDFVRGAVTGLDSLYFASGKMKASAANLEALRYAAEQNGLAFQGIAANIQTLANGIAYKNWGVLLRQFGVETKDANGKMRDTVLVHRDLMAEIARRPALQQGKLMDLFGIDPQEFEAYASGRMTKFFDDYQARLKATGTDLTKAAADSNKLETAMRSLHGEIEILKDRAVLALIDAWQQLSPATRAQIKNYLDLGQQIDRLTYWWAHLDETHKTTLKWAVTLAVGLAGLVAGLLAVGVGVLALGSVLEAGAVIFGVLSGPVGVLALAVVALGAGLVALGSAVGWDTVGAKCLALVGQLTTLVDTIVNKLKPALANMWSDLTRPGLRGDQGPLQFNGIDGAKQKAGAAFERFKALGTSDKSQPRGIRNNNPGNINYGDFAKGQGANGIEDTPRDGSKPRFATFATAQAGLDADAVLLRRYAAQGIDSVQAILSKYAPLSENPDLPAYIATVAKKLNVKAGDHLNFSDPAVLAQMEAAVVQVEVGKNPYASEMYAGAAKRAIGGGNESASGDVTIHQTVTTTVTGAADPKAVGAAVTNSVNQGNGLVLRALQPRTS
jgi:hypothetical protein